MSVREHRALRQLKNDKNIIILPADKGKTTVIMKKNEYEEKIKNLIEAELKCVESTMVNPAEKIKQETRKILKKFNLEKKIVIKDFCKIPHLYGLPKIHKETVPLRPIVSNIGSANHELARFVNKIISPLQEEISTCLKNTFEFIQKIKDLEVKKSDLLISFDVKSLFPSIPTEEVLMILKKRLEKDEKLKNRTNLNVEDILEITSFCLKKTYFQFNGKIYQQLDGLAMGSPLSPTLANLFMDDLEKKILDNQSILKPKIWLRYVDDIFAIWPHSKEELEIFLTYINSQNNRIKFTTEEETKNGLPFLDVLVQKKNEKLSTSLYSKPTHTGQYLNFKSCHSHQIKKGIVTTMMKRINSICSNEESKKEGQRKIVEDLKKNGYPMKFIKTEERRKKEDKNQDNKIYKATIKFPFSGQFSHKIKRIFNKYNIRVVNDSPNTLRRQLVKVAPEQSNQTKCGVVYKINTSCDKVYIGETGRQVKTRMKEHERMVKNENTEVSHLARHCNNCGCQPNLDSVTILKREDHWKARKIKEAMEMLKAGNENFARSSFDLSSCWTAEFLKHLER